MLTKMLSKVINSRGELRYLNISAASVGAIQRRLLVLEEQGVEPLFGEPALDLDDLLALADHVLLQEVRRAREARVGAEVLRERAEDAQ